MARVCPHLPSLPACRCRWTPGEHVCDSCGLMLRRPRLTSCPQGYPCLGAAHLDSSLLQRTGHVPAAVPPPATSAYQAFGCTLHHVYGPRKCPSPSCGGQNSPFLL